MKMTGLDAPYGSPQWYNAINYMNFTQLASQMAQTQVAQVQVHPTVPTPVAMLNGKYTKRQLCLKTIV